MTFLGTSNKSPTFLQFWMKMIFRTSLAEIFFRSLEGLLKTKRPLVFSKRPRMDFQGSVQTSDILFEESVFNLPGPTLEGWSKRYGKNPMNWDRRGVCFWRRNRCVETWRILRIIGIALTEAVRIESPMKNGIKWPRGNGGLVNRSNWAKARPQIL